MRDPEKVRAALKRYQASPKGRAKRRTYDRSEKGKARQAKWRQSEKNKAAQKRYRDSAKGQAARAKHRDRNNARRLQIGYRYVGLADTPEAAAAINAHIRRRRLEFIKGQSAREKTEGV